VYLLHFASPIGELSNPRGAAQHYMGWTGSYLGPRLASHRDGVGAAIMKAVADAGIDFTVARTWEGSRRLERSLKNRHDHPGLCPLCHGQEPQLDPATKIIDVGKDVDRWLAQRRRELGAAAEAAPAPAPLPNATTGREQAAWPIPEASWAPALAAEQERGWER
jgi:hypothetical protein